MLASEARADASDDVSKTLARVIDREPDWAALPDHVPPVLTSFLRGCLQKSLKKRIRDIGDVGLALEGAFEVGVAAVSETVVSLTLPLWQRPIGIAATAVTALALGALAVWTNTTPEPRDLIRFSIVPPDTASLRFGRQRQDVVMTRDGTQIIYHANQGDAISGGSQLILRPIDQLGGESLRGTEDGFAPFVSSNGEWVGFQSSSSTLQKVSIFFGGQPEPLVQSENNIVGVSWGSDDDVIFGTDRAGLFRVSASGGEPEILTILDSAHSESSHTWPFIIPGREAVLFVASTGSVLTTGQLAVLDSKTGEVSRLGLGGFSPRYTATGHLVYATEDGSVRAVPFDSNSLEVDGSPVPLVEGVTVKATGAANFDISGAGRLVYVRGAGQGELRSLVWVDREGREEEIGLPPSRYSYPRISPDGGRVAVVGRGGDSGRAIWIWNFEQATRVRLTVGDGRTSSPIWTPNGERLVYEKDGSFYAKGSNNTGTPDLLVTDPRSEGAANPNPLFFSPEGAALVFRDQETPETDDDLVMISLEGETEVVWNLNENFRELNAELSPNGRWMAYQSDESGEFEVYVRPFPRVDDNQIPISNDGGIEPLWSRDGRELFYMQPGSATHLISASIETNQGDGTLTVGERETIMEWPYSVEGEGRSFDVSLTGQRFLALKQEIADGEDGTTPSEITVVLNWDQELLERVPIP